MKFEILIHLSCFNETGTIFSGWIGNQESVFPQTFHGPSVSQGETCTTVFGWTNVPFTQNNPIKFEILTFWLTWTKLAQSFLGWIGNQKSVFLQTFHGPSVSQYETCTTIFGWANVPYRQNEPMIFEILTHLVCFNEIGTFISGLNWKPSVNFPPIFSWPFSVTRWNSYHSSPLNKCTF